MIVKFNTVLLELRRRIHKTLLFLIPLYPRSTKRALVKMCNLRKISQHEKRRTFLNLKKSKLPSTDELSN